AVVCVCFFVYCGCRHCDLHSFPTRRSSDLGEVATKVVPAEGGMLAFITPNEALNSGTAYTLSLNGPEDKSGQSLPDTQVLFTTSDRKSTRLNSSHQIISYAVFCLKKKITQP